jgi:hypothetical protein
MTDRLQVMDLVVNGPLKAFIRASRCSALLEYFKGWRIRMDAQALRPHAEREYPPFAPPKPTLASGLRTLRNACSVALVTPKFKAGMERAFIKVGLMVNPETDVFRTYISHTNASSPLKLLPDDAPSVGDVFDLGGDLSGSEIGTRAGFDDDDIFLSWDELVAKDDPLGFDSDDDEEDDGATPAGAGASASDNDEASDSGGASGGASGRGAAGGLRAVSRTVTGVPLLPTLPQGFAFLP